MHEQFANLSIDYLVGLGIGIMMGGAAVASWAVHYWPKRAAKQPRNAKGQFARRAESRRVVESRWSLKMGPDLFIPDPIQYD